MSTNVYINAVRDVIVIKTGEKSQQSKKFNAWQTPTKVTYNIIGKDGLEEKIKAYADWVLSIIQEEEIPVYEKDDFFRERDPVGTRKIHSGKDHIEQLSLWIESVTEAGYEVEFDYW